MADENEAPAEGQEPEPQPIPDKAGALADFRARIKGNIASATAPDGSVFDRVVEELAERKRKEYVDLLIKGFDQLDSINRNLKKVGRPDNVFYDGAGKPMNQYSKGRLEEIKKAKEAAAKLYNALEAAISSAAFDKLKEAIDKTKDQAK